MKDGFFSICVTHSHRKRTVNFNVMSNSNSVHSCSRNLLGNNESDAYSNIKCHRTNIEISNFIIIGCDDYWLLIEIKVTCHLFAADFMWNYFRRTPFCSRMYDTLIDVPIQKCRRQMVILAEKRNLGETYSFFFISKPPALADAAFIRTLPPRLPCLLYIDYITYR